jgi:hypothetical protein
MFTAMETPQNYQDILARVNTFNMQVKEARAKSAGTTVTEEDTRNMGGAGTPNLSEAKDTNKTRNDKSNEGNKLEDEATQPSGTGKNVPATQDGNAKEDAATSPTTPLGKIAKIKDRVSEVKKRIEEYTQAEDSEEGEEDDMKAKEEGQMSSANMCTSSKEANTFLAGNFDDDYLRKLGSVIVEMEGGLAAVEPILLKAAGQQEAYELMQRAAVQYDQYAQHANAIQQEEMYKMAYAQEVQNAFGSMLANSSPQEQQDFVKLAHAHGGNTAEYQDEMLKQAYMQGAGDAAAMMDAQEAAPAGAAVGLPGAAQGEPTMEEIAGLIEQMVQEGDLDEETAAAVLAEMQGGMGEDNMPSMEEVVQLLDAMVSAGELDEETAAGIVEEIASGGAMADQGGMIAEASADDLFNALVRV